MEKTITAMLLSLLLCSTLNAQNTTSPNDIGIITITDDELEDDTGIANHTTGLLEVSKDTYLRTAAFEFSAAFFKVRGLDSQYGTILINGIEMNKPQYGRPEWSNWGGLNDATRNQEFSSFLHPSSYAFGGILGTTHINTIASDYRKGGSFSYASSNRSYQHRVMTSYFLGLLKDGWSFAVSGSKRTAKEGYNEGTFYDASSLLVSVGKQFSNKHNINFTSITAFNKRGKSAPHTQEVYDIKGTRYNEYWGYQNRKKRNARVKRVEEPILMLNHDWKMSTNISLQTNFAYQFGTIGNSRLDYNGGNNPSPVYKQNLPSYWLNKNNFQQAYEAEEHLNNYGQINWHQLYKENKNLATLGQNAAYVLYEDRNDDTQITANSILNIDITNNSTITGKINYKKLHSKNFASVLDLLGGSGYTDINPFAKLETPERQNNLLKPNRIIQKGDPFKYNYILSTDMISGFVQGQFNYKKADFYLAGNLSKTSYQREGFYKNGRFPNHSLGKSERIHFTNFGLKGGSTYKLTGRHLFTVNGGYLTKAPTLSNTFSNPRENNAIVNNIQNEKIATTDISYVYRGSKIKSKLTGYYTAIKDATDINFFFTEGNFNTFVQEIITGISKNHIGIELGMEAQLTSTFKLKTAANYGQYTYTNNPTVYITSEDFITNNNEYGIKNLGNSYLKNYKIATGPQKAYSFGFDYKNPNYWWISATLNYFDDIYLDINPIKRTNHFYKASDGLAINTYNRTIAKQLLTQEKIDAYSIVNIVGGISWRFGKNYNIIGGILGINNLLNTSYKTAGFEQARVANYEQLVEEKMQSKPLFSPKYWYGRGANYFLTIYYRF